MHNESNILNEINSIIQFATEYPRLDGEHQEEHQEESAAEPRLKKMDKDIMVLEW